MKSETSDITADKVAGKKTDGRGDCCASWRVATVNDCTLYAFMEAVYNDNLQALVMSGTPPVDQLELARVEIVSRFSELSGQSSARRDITVRVARLRLEIIGMSSALHLLSNGKERQARDCLSGLGVRLPDDTSKARRMLAGLIKGKIVALTEEQHKLELIKKRHKPSTLDDFHEQITVVSRYMGFHIDVKTITVSEYAYFFKTFKREQHGKKSII